MKKSFSFVFVAVLVLVSFVPATVVAQEREELASTATEAATSEVVGDFTIKTFPSLGKYAVTVSRMITLSDGKVIESPGYNHLNVVYVEYVYSTERKGYPVKSRTILAPAYQHVELVGAPEYLKKLPWAPPLKVGQAAWEVVLDYGKEYLYAAGFANDAEASAFGKKFVAYVTNRP